MEEKVFHRGSGGKVTRSEMIQIIADYLAADTNSEYEITVGTDSQNHDKTKMVEVIAVARCGHGGIFFYRTEYLKRIRTIKEKIIEETSRSIENANGLVDGIGVALIDKDIDIDELKMTFKIHCDIGHYGKTNELITEIVGWVHSAGYDCAIKPESYTASGIANKITK